MTSFAPAIRRLLEGPAPRVGPFVLIKQLGRGSSAPVWLARETYGTIVLREAAVKLFALPQRTEGEPSALIVAEARALCQVEHPNVVRFYSLPMDDASEVMGLAMEYVAGVTLQHRLGTEARLGVASAVKMAVAVASALATIHRAGLVHRDVKPANVVEAEAQFKLIDFGIAAVDRLREANPPSQRVLILDDLPIEAYGTQVARLGSIVPHDADAGLSRVGQNVPCGTIGYIDPVCVSTGATATPASDLYALGAMLFECLTGILPAAAAMMRGDGLKGEVLDGRSAPPPIATVVQGLPRDLSRIVDRLLAPDRDARACPAEDVAEQLRAVLIALEGGGSNRQGPAPPSVATDAYDSAIQSLRDANWNRAHAELERALVANPRMAAAQLRYSLTCLGRKLPAEVQAEFHKAIQLRYGLTERDRVMLRALEPLLLWDPRDERETHDRLSVACSRFSTDTEFHVLAAYLAVRSGAPSAEQFARRAVELDSQYGDALNTLGIVLGSSGDRLGALEAFDRCIEVSPGAADAYLDRALVHAGDGDHERVEIDARRGMSLGTDLRFAELRASALYAFGRPVEAIFEVIRQGLEVVPASRRALETARYEAVMAVLAGDFANAAQVTESCARAASAAIDGETHAVMSVMRVRIAVEMGLEREAGRLAHDYLNRRDSLVRPGSVHLDPTPLMAATALQAGYITAHEAHVFRSTWTAEWSPSAEPSVLWALGHSAFARFPGAAVKACTLIPRSVEHSAFRRPLLNWDFGTILRAAGRTEEAIYHLRRAGQSTMAVADPFRHTLANHELGLALEMAGDRAGALEAQGTVLARWGTAVPHSVSADAARQRLMELRCGRG
jgi:serine/threonine protein kinase